MKVVKVAIIHKTSHQICFERGEYNQQLCHILEIRYCTQFNSFSIIIYKYPHYIVEVADVQLDRLLVLLVLNDASLPFLSQHLHDLHNLHDLHPSPSRLKQLPSI